CLDQFALLGRQAIDASQRGVEMLLLRFDVAVLVDLRQLEVGEREVLVYRKRPLVLAHGLHVAPFRGEPPTVGVVSPCLGIRRDCSSAVPSSSERPSSPASPVAFATSATATTNLPGGSGAGRGRTATITASAAAMPAIDQAVLTLGRGCTRSRAPTRSRADWKRSSGLFARQRATIFASAAGVRWGSGGGSSRRMAAPVAISVSRSNGRWPVSISCNT